TRVKEILQDPALAEQGDLRIRVMLEALRINRQRIAVAPLIEADLPQPLPRQFMVRLQGESALDRLFRFIELSVIFQNDGKPEEHLRVLRMVALQSPELRHRMGVILELEIELRQLEARAPVPWILSKVLGKRHDPPGT